MQTNHNLTILSMAMQRAGILDLLYTEGPLTLLAPSNEAFELLGEAYPDLYNVLFTHPFRLHLLDLLHSHIVEGRVIWLSDMTDGMVIYAKTNEDISVTRTINPQQQQEEVVCLKPSLQDEACVILGDVEATNGVAHVLDGVITPAWVLYSIRDAVVAVFPRLASLVECANLSNLLATKIGLTVRS